MKKILLSTLFLGVCAFSYEVNFNKSFSKSVNADSLVSNINISVEKDDEKSVNSEIEKFNDFLKETKDIEIKNANYNLSPKYVYEKNKSIFKGYLGENRFTIKSKDASKINDFLTNLTDLKDSIDSKDIELRVSNLSWQVSAQLRDSTLNELRLESLLWVQNYAKSLSEKISKKCEVKNVHINESFAHPRAMAMASNPALDSVKSFVSKEVAPISSEESITINTNLVLDCK